MIPRDKIDFNHKNLIKLGFKKHKEVINIYKKTSIAMYVQDGKNLLEDLV